MEPLKIICFDLYGTILYISKNISLYKEIIKASPKPRVTWEYMCTRYFQDIEALYAALIRIGLIQENKMSVEEFKSSIEKEIKSVKVHDDVKESLSRLKEKGYYRAVISNVASPYLAAYRKLQAEENFAFDLLLDYQIFSCEKGFSKPSEKIYNEILKHAGCDFEEIGYKDILMIGDNYTNDFLVPKSLGMQALHLDRKGNNSETTINSLSVLLERL